MIKIRKVRFLLVIAVLIAAAMAFLLLKGPNQIAAARDAPNAPNTLLESRAWVTSYDDAGGMMDITAVTCGATPGYQTYLSPYVGAVVSLENDSYVLNWRPYDLGSDMQLCGLRVAYRLPLGAGEFDPSFSYTHVAGSVLRPRDSSLEWDSDSSGGCLYASEGDPYNIFNTHMNIPDGSRIDFLRIYCYREMALFLPIVAK